MSRRASPSRSENTFSAAVFTLLNAFSEKAMFNDESHVELFILLICMIPFKTVEELNGVSLVLLEGKAKVRDHEM